MLREVPMVDRALATAHDPPHRGSRLPEFLANVVDADATLNGLTLAVVGTGSVGGNIAMHAARLQVRELICVDPSSYKEVSILTQPILPADVGRAKASVIGERCKAISPRTHVRIFDGPVQVLDLTALADADIVALASDNIACEIALGARCLALRQPLVIAAVHGESLSAQVRFYGNARATSPCPACDLSEREWSQVDAETRFSCEGRFDARPVAVRMTQPTRSPSFLCSLAADLALQQILRFTLKLGSDLTDTRLEYSGYRDVATRSALQAKESCPSEHVSYTQRFAPLADSSLRYLAQEAGVHGRELESASFSAGHLVFVERARCPRGHTHTVDRFHGERQRVGLCRHCDAASYAQPFFSRRRVPYALAAKVAHLPLREICEPLPQWVAVHHTRSVLFRAEAGSNPAPSHVTKESVS